MERPVARQLEPELYEEEDEDALVMILTDDLDLVQVRPPTLVVNRNDLLLDPLDRTIDIMMERITRQEEQTSASAAAYMVPDNSVEADVSSDSDTGNECEDGVNLDMVRLCRKSLRERQAYIRNIPHELVEQITVYAEEHLAPLSLEAQAWSVGVEAADLRPWAATAQARALEARRRQQRQKGEEGGSVAPPLY